MNGVHPFEEIQTIVNITPRTTAYSNGSTDTHASSTTTGSGLKSKIRSHRMSSPVVYERVLSCLGHSSDHHSTSSPSSARPPSPSPSGLPQHPPHLPLPLPMPLGIDHRIFGLTDPFESFLMREYLENVAPMMNLYALDSVFTHILPWLALRERVLYDSILALSSLSVYSKSPGRVSRDIPEQYKQNALAAIRRSNENGSGNGNWGQLQEDSTPYPRKMLYLCCSLLIILFNIVAADTKTVLSDLEEAYARIKIMAVGRPHVNSGDAQDNGARDLFIVCVGLAFSLDFVISFRFNTCCAWDPAFLESVFENESLPIHYTNEWWLQKSLLLLVRLSHFQHRSHVPTYEEHYGNNTNNNSNIGGSGGGGSSQYPRMAEWAAIYTDLLEYGRLLPLPLKPIAQIQAQQHSDMQSTFSKVYVFDEYALLANVSYHTGVIMALHLRPDQTELQKLSVPRGAREHAYQILGLLDTCDKPMFWVTIYWAHRTAAICLTGAEEREDALYLTRQYEWRTGYTFTTHLKLIEDRWNVVDKAAAAVAAEEEAAAAAASAAAAANGHYYHHEP